MKLSAAILQGGKGITKGHYTLLSSDGSYCVLGAACLGVGIKPRVGTEFSYKLRSVFPELKTFKIGSRTLESKLVELNDDCSWSFKSIVTWLKRKGL